MGAEGSAEMVKRCAGWPFGGGPKLGRRREMSYHELSVWILDASIEDGASMSSVPLSCLGAWKMRPSSCDR